MRPRLGVGDTLHAMDAGFELELGESAAAADFRDNLLVAAHAAFAGGHHLDLPALPGGETLVHAEQIAGEQRRLVAAGAGADFKNDVALVHGILGQQRELDLLLQRRAPLLEVRLLGGRHLAHLGVGRGIVEQRLEARDLGDHAAIVLHGLDDRPELGELARKLDIGLGRELPRELAFDRLVAGEQCVQFCFGQHSFSPRMRGQICRFCSAANALSRSRIGTLPAGPSAARRAKRAALRASSSSSIALTGPTADGDSDSER